MDSGYYNLILILPFSFKCIIILFSYFKAPFGILIQGNNYNQRQFKAQPVTPCICAVFLNSAGEIV